MATRSITSISPNAFSLEAEPVSSVFGGTPVSGPVLPSAESLDPHTQEIWEHFHTMPHHADQGMLNLFFIQQDEVEDSMPLPKGNVFVQPKQVRKFPPKEKIFKCPITDCPSGYQSKKNLFEHFKKKHQPSPQSLKELKMKFDSRKEKAFPCPITDCPSGYSGKRDLDDHLKEKHQISPNL